MCVTNNKGEKKMKIIIEVLETVIHYLQADWWILLIGILIATSIKVFIKPEMFRNYIEKRANLSVIGSIAFGAFTPLCACGTTAVLLSMFASSLPWGGVMAFLVSSPLTSPSEFLFQSSFIGMNFAIAVLITSLVLGLIAGIGSNLLSKRTTFFHNQYRMSRSTSSSGCNSQKETVSSCSTSDDGKTSCSKEIKQKPNIVITFVKEFYNLGVKKVLFMFIIFIAIGSLIQYIIPQSLILSLFGTNNAVSIPLGALIGLPLYVSGPSALPLMQTFLEQGATESVLLAFLITGKATGVPVIAGLSAIIKRKAIALYVGFVLIGGITAGYIYDFVQNIL